MEHGHEEQHPLSPWALIVGVGFFVLYLGLAIGGLTSVLTALGLLVLGVALVGWTREESKIWPMTFAPTPGNHVGFWGAVYFLCTEFMLFGGLFAAYFASKARAPVWPPAGDVELPVLMTGINTLILIASGATMHWGLVGLRNGNRRKFNIGLVLTLILGTVFLAIQAVEYAELIGHGFVLGSSQFSQSFYLLTGTHGLHVFAGLVFILLILVRSLAGNFSADNHVAVECAAVYWHFVDAVWIFLYAVVYLEVI